MRVCRSSIVAGLVVPALVAAGCGSDSTADKTGDQGSGVPAPTARGGAAEREAPKGASPVLREIYRQFPKPQADPAVRASAAAIAAGRKACRGKTPLQVKEEFYPKAVEKGALRADSPRGQMIAEVASIEARSGVDPSFAAGQLAAAAYEAAQPQATAHYGYRGCVYSLARELQRKLASR
jgi:hypothetical protein